MCTPQAEGLNMGEVGMNVGVLWEDHCLWQLSLSIVHLKNTSILEGLKLSETFCNTVVRGLS